MLNYIYDEKGLKDIYNSTLITGGEWEKLEKQYEKMFKKYLNVKDGGFTVYSKTKSKIGLSKGCQACKNGKWLCVFVGYNCNCKCDFCPQPKSANFLNVFNDVDLTSHGTMSELEYYISTDKTIEGISYSGGEPLLYFDKVKKLAEFVHKKAPKIYQWIYTNGVLLDEKKLEILAKNGINEVRLDLAATKFDVKILDKIALTKKYIENVTVEIPAIDEIRILLKDNLLDKLVADGLSRLNISEMNIAQEINLEKYGKNTVLVGHKGYYKCLSLLESTEIYYEFLDYVVKHDLDLMLNNCNYGAKFVQIMNKERNQKLYKS